MIAGQAPLPESATGLGVLVTGGSSGIGAATARLLAARGDVVAITGRRKGPLLAVAREIGGHAVVGDVSDPDRARRIVEEAWQLCGGLYAVVNSAGICVPYALADLTPARWHESISVNLSGTFYVSQAAGVKMRDAGGGVVVNVGTENSLMGMPMYVAYCASKTAILGLTRGLAAELAPKVRVNAVLPGPVDTPMLRAEVELFDDPQRVWQENIDRVPMNRLASAEEIARSILHLIDAPFATGALLSVDGGTTIV